MNALSARAISLLLGKKLVVDHLEIAVDANEFVGLIGPNGAGKSSVLRLLAGLLPSATGSINLQYRNTTIPIDKIPALNRAKLLAYLAQNENPVWPLSVRNVVALGRTPWAARMRASADDEVAIQRAMQMTNVLELADRPITELSGGELQRTLLARVFAGKPHIILADEPIAALDVYHQLHIMELLQAHAQQGGAVIAALHDLSLAARFCSRLILMHHGKIIAEGEPAHVLTAENMATVYGIQAHVDCRADGIVIIPVKRVAHL